MGARSRTARLPPPTPARRPTRRTGRRTAAPPGSQHYSPLQRIDPGNVARLGLAWSYDLPPGNSVSAPVAHEGVVYTATGYSVVTALDAATGRELWRHDPRTAEAAGWKLRRGWGSRGLAYRDGRIFVGTQDGRLIALDARSGRPIWSAMTVGKHDQRYITGAPLVFRDKVLIGHGGADAGKTRGYVTCYDAATGRQLWRFFTVPGDPARGFEDETQAMAAATWSGEWWKGGGGGTVWNAMSYDPELDTVLIGVGNGQPKDHGIRSQGKGDNLFLASIVALDAETGAYRWHYQVNPGESWDYTATMDIELADLALGGRVRKVLLHAPKNGFFYVVDRTNGRLISAEPFARVTWATRIDLATGRPVENPAARRYSEAPFELWPAPTGAHPWLPMAFSPRTGLVYLPVSERPVIMGGGEGGSDPQLPGSDRSRLVAWDPVRQQAVWQVDTPGMWGGGAIATGGGLVFQGQMDQLFNAYDARTGRRLWSFDARAPVIAPPITYEAGGVQYVTVLTGFGVSAAVFGRTNQAFNLDYRTMQRRVLTFALGGKAALPPLARPAPAGGGGRPRLRARPFAVGPRQGRLPIDLPPLPWDERHRRRRGPRPARVRRLPDRSVFHAIVREGALLTQGMPRFDDLPEETVEDIRFYLRTRARELPAPA
ncbi:PQQ-binding-like beta-propeller repeat protein [Phenylobacterium sp. J367]|uniref:outer membrane protein assembly factor BamB family protein n=1 Tax=Phenylobacterium sp. J367 TaxID=2898435 RepID=UPI00215095DF|nr:PQQ-binding-like beta-propeller repeat protein [Phenylobacterium sp. J367]MCR5879595.1 PQQ-binding-like beta-propeller repeat protein [Phenylobacterium sp. J367]